MRADYDPGRIYDQKLRDLSEDFRLSDLAGDVQRRVRGAAETPQTATRVATPQAHTLRRVWVRASHRAGGGRGARRVAVS